MRRFLEYYRFQRGDQPIAWHQRSSFWLVNALVPFALFAFDFVARDLNGGWGPLTARATCFLTVVWCSLGAILNGWLVIISRAWKRTLAIVLVVVWIALGLGFYFGNPLS